MILVALICGIYGAENGTSRCHLAVFNVDVVFSCHVAPHHPHCLPLFSTSIGMHGVFATPVRTIKLKWWAI